MKSKAHYFVIIFLVIFINSAFSQITFQKTYGGAQDDYFYSVQQTADGGYIMVGSTNSFGAGNYDVYLVKTDLNGDTLWTKTYGGTANDFGNCVQQTTDSGYIVIGSTQSFGSGQKIVYLIKTNFNGDTLWTRTFKPYSGMGGPPGGIGFSVKQTYDEGYILDCGNSEDVEFLIKTDALGDTLWTKSYKIMSSSSEVQQTTDSGYIITGTGDDGTNFYYMYLIKTDINGNSIWKKKYGGNSYGEWSFSVRQTIDGGYITGGYSNNSLADVYINKTNSSGDTLWTKAYGGDSVDAGFCINITGDSGYIIVGVTKSFGAGNNDAYIIKTNAMGDTLWTKTFGGINNEEGRSVQQTVDGGYIIAGNTNSFGAGGYEAYLIKTDANGNSGCNENDAATIVRTIPTTVSLPVDTFLLGPIVINSYSSLISGGGIINILCTNVDIIEITEEEKASIYPNPARDNFTIYISAELYNANLEIRNVRGEKIYSMKLNRKRESISCNEFSSGIYFIALRMGNEVITKKLIVIK